MKVDKKRVAKKDGKKIGTFIMFTYDANIFERSNYFT